MINYISIVLSQKKLSQKDTAIKTGITPQYLNRVIRGKIVPSVELALKIAASLNVLVEDLWTLEKIDE